MKYCDTCGSTIEDMHYEGCDDALSCGAQSAGSVVLTKGEAGDLLFVLRFMDDVIFQKDLYGITNPENWELSSSVDEQIAIIEKKQNENK